MWRRKGGRLISFCAVYLLTSILNHEHSMNFLCEFVNFEILLSSGFRNILWFGWIIFDASALLMNNSVAIRLAQCWFNFPRDQQILLLASLSPVCSLVSAMLPYFNALCFSWVVLKCGESHVTRRFAFRNLHLLLLRGLNQGKVSGRCLQHV
jgi:hypothetical protein